MTRRADDRAGDRLVLMLIGGGIITLLMSIIAAITFAKNMPDWAESVFAMIAGGAIVKLADVLSTLVALSGSRQLERMGDQLANATPIDGTINAHIVNPPTDPVPTIDEGNV